MRNSFADGGQVRVGLREGDEVGPGERAHPERRINARGRWHSSLGYLTPNEFEDIHSNPNQQATLS